MLRAGVGWSAGSIGHATGQSGRASLVGYTAMAGEPVTSDDLAADERFDISAFMVGHDVTSAAIFLARPAAVFMLLVRNASENRF